MQLKQYVNLGNSKVLKLGKSMGLRARYAIANALEIKVVYLCIIFLYFLQIRS